MQLAAPPFATVGGSLTVAFLLSLPSITLMTQQKQAMKSDLHQMLGLLNSWSWIFFFSSQTERTFVCKSHWVKLSTASSGRLPLGRPTPSYPSDGFLLETPPGKTLPNLPIERLPLRDLPTHWTTSSSHNMQLPKLPSLGNPTGSNTCMLKAGVNGQVGLPFAPYKDHATRNHSSMERLLFFQS